MTLTLQVNDDLDLAPAFNFIHPLAAAAGDTRTVLASSDLGGERTRTYIGTFYIESDKLTFPDERAARESAETGCEGEKYSPRNLYSLRGDLRLSEIVEIGEKSLTSKDHLSPGPAPDITPSFGSPWNLW